MSADTLVVLDFETTGLSPNRGDRAIEIGAVKLVEGEVVDRFQRLMNPGFAVSPFIESYCGISNAMLREAPPCETVMAEFADFIGDHNLVAHNASFDRRFLDAELDRIGRHYPGEFACSLLLARRIYPEAPDHKLGTLVAYKGIANDGVFHRALADTEVTAGLWQAMMHDLQQRCGFQPSFAQLQTLCRKPKGAVADYLAKLARC
ncbi:3'-5' exonuclease [Ferrimonas marina]|uniref:DNA-directed DNA polymerase n=1 Tax=Ferrimonas marina TaxID=299255 RepID=A0A1M5XZS1_9GAMM|nr:3'-5' exonuclease [Ferrimonas marina]SHI05242.1 DNA polymerase-3 subunit epsilon [Ferrimonas marina]